MSYHANPACDYVRGLSYCTQGRTWEVLTVFNAQLLTQWQRNVALAVGDLPTVPGP
jgi:hypothetical protein